MSAQSLLFIPDLKGTPRYELNSKFHDIGIITYIEELKPLERGGAYNYRYTIGNSRYVELFLVNYEIEHSYLDFSSLDPLTKELYLINFPK